MAGDRPEDQTAVGEELAAALDLGLLPLEGGLFRSTFVGGGVSAILFMLIDDDFSAMHRLQSDEIYFYHSGAPLRMLLIDPEGVPAEVIIGPDALAGQHPQFHVPAYWWQGSSTDGPWSLVSTMVTPAFDWQQFVLAEREVLADLVSRHNIPGITDRIAALTRRDHAVDQPDEFGADT